MKVLCSYNACILPACTLTYLCVCLLHTYFYTHTCKYARAQVFLPRVLPVLCVMRACTSEVQPGKVARVDRVTYTL